MGRTRVQQTGILIPDTHIPLHSREAVNVLYKAIKLVKPDIVIHLGDVGEWDAVSSWKYMKKKRPPLEYIVKDLDKDVAAVNAELNKLDKVCKSAGVKDKIVLGGNHEVWLENFVEEHDYLPQYTPQKAMRLDERGWKWIRYGEYLTMGEVSLYHGGHYSGLHHARQHLINLGTNVIYAHGHGVQRASIANLKGVHSAFCLGCLKSCQNENNKWLKGRKMNWSHSFGIIYWNGDGTFRCEQVDITAGITHVWGKILDGNI